MYGINIRDIKIILSVDYTGTNCMESEEIHKICPYGVFNVLDMKTGIAIPNLTISDIKYLIRNHYKLNFNLQSTIFAIIDDIIEIEKNDKNLDKFIYILPRDKDLFYNLLIDNNFINHKYQKRKNSLKNNINLIYSNEL